MPGTTAQQRPREELIRCRRTKPCTSLMFDAIKPHLAPAMLGLHCTHVLRHQYPSTPHPLFPTYPRTVRGPRANTVLLFHTDQMNRVHSSGEAPHSFTMAPCVILERLEGKHWSSRTPVGEHAELQAREWLLHTTCVRFWYNWSADCVMV